MRISLIGSGNVATHLAAAFRNAGHVLVQVYSRDPQHAAMLAYHVGAGPVSDLAMLRDDIDLLLIAVSDDAIPDIVNALNGQRNALVAHTSGSTPLFVLEKFAKAGVFYPLQTFSKTVSVDMRQVPVCIEGASREAFFTLQNLASDISNQVEEIDSERRFILHIAAVFTSNFVNYLYAAGRQLLEKHALDFSLLRPLIMQSAVKVMDADPAAVQTGPAVRNDRRIMDRHLERLQSEPDLARLYAYISEAIVKSAQEQNAGR
ncbi:MAG: DUF2520 domain-containing protein [Mucilaginibacter polytrichastri]|nr:DUF2520 domain-containing protein [Mucilaginibacter polytrichastri]